MRDLQRKVESDPVGRAAITILIVFALATLVVLNLPPSAVERRLDRLAQPLRNGLGFDQAWGVFAPDPPQESSDLHATIAYSDGSKEDWHWPKGDPFFSEYRAYHWEKWAEQAKQDSHDDLWRPLAVWLAHTHVSANRRPVTITLIRWWYENRPPGSHPARGPLHEEAFFTYQVQSSIGAAP